MKIRFSFLFLVAPLFAPPNTTIGKKRLQPDIAKTSYLQQLVQDNSFLTKNQIMCLLHAISLFIATPGFEPTLSKAIENNHNGHLYEIEKATALAKKGLTILAFNEEKECDHCKREFDIIARDRHGNQHWIECKNTNWKNGKKHQFKEQKMIAQTHDSKKRQIMYRVCSKQSITDSWKEWFHNNEITFEEDSN